jgi:hypothetical protein
VIPKPSDILEKHIKHISDEAIFKKGGKIAIVGDGGPGTTVYHTAEGSDNSRVLFEYKLN